MTNSLEFVGLKPCAEAPIVSNAIAEPGALFPGSNGVLNAARLTLSVGRTYPDFLHQTATSTTPPHPDAQLIDVIQQLMSLLSHKTTTMFAMHTSHTSLLLPRSSQRLLIDSHTVVQIVTAPRSAEEAKRLGGARTRAMHENTKRENRS